MIPVTSTPELLIDDCETDKMDTMPIVSTKTSGSSVNQMEIEMNDDTCVPDVEMETIDSGNLSEERVEEKRCTNTSSV
ncbi:unnamed protein product [Ixodes pacificus]